MANGKNKIYFSVKRFSTFSKHMVDCDFAYIVQSTKELIIRLPQHTLTQQEAIQFADWIKQNLS